VSKCTHLHSHSLTSFDLCKKISVDLLLKAPVSRLLVAYHLLILLLPLQNVNEIKAFKSHYRLLVSVLRSHRLLIMPVGETVIPVHDRDSFSGWGT